MCVRSYVRERMYECMYVHVLCLSVYVRVDVCVLACVSVRVCVRLRVQVRIACMISLLFDK